MSDQSGDPPEILAPESTLPADLQAIIVEFSGQKRFRIQGFVIRKDKDNQPWWTAFVRGNSVLLVYRFA